MTNEEGRGELSLKISAGAGVCRTVPATPGLLTFHPTSTIYIWGLHNSKYWPAGEIAANYSVTGWTCPVQKLLNQSSKRHKDFLKIVYCFMLNILICSCKFVF